LPVRQKKISFFVLILVALGGLQQACVPAIAQSTPAAPAVRVLTPVTQVTHPPIAEMSGIVKSVRYPHVFWVQNDSGDEARIFAIRPDGSTIMPSWLGGDFYTGTVPVEGKKLYPGIQIAVAANSDWEDIAIDGDTLYLADTGNNGNARRDLGLYVVAEPNPEATFQTRPLKWLPIAYPDQAEFPGTTRWEFDCEAIFVYKNKPYLITKHRAPNKIDTPAVSANLYRLDSQYTDKVNKLTKVDGIADLGGWVTSAKLSPDGKTLAVLCESPVSSVWLFETPRSGDTFFSSRARRLIFTGGKQCEAICFDGNDTLVIANEQRDVFRVSVSDFTSVLER
jgi:hypothetical protein